MIDCNCNIKSVMSYCKIEYTFHCTLNAPLCEESALAHHLTKWWYLLGGCIMWYSSYHPQNACIHSKPVRKQSHLVLMVDGRHAHAHDYDGSPCYLGCARHYIYAQSPPCVCLSHEDCRTIAWVWCARKIMCERCIIIIIIMNMSCGHLIVLCIVCIKELWCGAA